MDSYERALDYSQTQRELDRATKTYHEINVTPSIHAAMEHSLIEWKERCKSLTEEVYRLKAELAKVEKDHILYRRLVEKLVLEDF